MNLFINYSPQWKWTGEVMKAIPKYERLIVFEGINSLKILQTYVLKNCRPLCSSRSLKLFELENNELVCAAEEQDVNYYSSMAELLNEFQKSAKECLIISLQSSSEYKTEERVQECTIRGINSKFNDIPSLQAPNFLTGIAAGVVSQRIMDKSPFSAHVIYVDFYDEQAIKVILNHLKRINLQFDESVKIKPLHHKSDLYM